MPYNLNTPPQNYYPDDAESELRRIDTDLSSPSSEVIESINSADEPEKKALSHIEDYVIYTLMYNNQRRGDQEVKELVTKANKLYDLLYDKKALRRAEESIDMRRLMTLASEFAGLKIASLSRLYSGNHAYTLNDIQLKSQQDNWYIKCK